MSKTTITLLVRSTSNIASLIKDKEEDITKAMNIALDLVLIDLEIRYIQYQPKPLMIESSKLTDNQIVDATATLYHVNGQLTSRQSA